MTKREWYAVDATACLGGVVVSLLTAPLLAAPLKSGTPWVQSIYLFETRHDLLLCVVFCVLLLAEIYKRRHRMWGREFVTLCFFAGALVGRLILHAI